MTSTTPPRLYLDHNATTRPAPEVVEAMLHAQREAFGNPNSIHPYGVDARYLVEKARRTIAKHLNAGKNDRLIFTSGGTESDNLALRGICRWGRKHLKGNHLIVSSADHKAVLETAKDLRDNEGFDLTILPVYQWGRVRPGDLRAALRPDTLLVSIIYANSEIGSLNPIKELAEITHKNSNALFHTDAVQAVGKISVDIQHLGIDLLTSTAHKLYGPKGCGLLYIKEGIQLKPMITGGGHEDNLRSGTENVPGIVGFAKALDLAISGLDHEIAHLTNMRENLWTRLQNNFPTAIRNFPYHNTLPGTLNLSFPGVNGRDLVYALAEEGIACSTGSACSSQETSYSHVLLAMGADEDRAAGAIRFSLGRLNNPDDLQHLLASLQKRIPALINEPQKALPFT